MEHRCWLQAKPNSKNNPEGKQGSFNLSVMDGANTLSRKGQRRPTRKTFFATTAIILIPLSKLVHCVKEDKRAFSKEISLLFLFLDRSLSFFTMNVKQFCQFTKIWIPHVFIDDLPRY